MAGTLDSINLYEGDVHYPPNGDTEPASLQPQPTGNHIPRGFPVKVLNIVDDKFLCGICNEILREPAQSKCGHR